MKGSLYAIIASVIIACSFLMRKKALKNNSAKNIVFFVFCGIIISSTLIAIILNNNDKNIFKNMDNKMKIISVIAGMLIPLGIFALTISLKMVSNPAYTGIIYAVFKTILLFIFSVYLFNSHYNKMTLIGIILSLIGVSIIIKHQ